jgi:peptide/nickel transport system permease protein
MMRLIASRLLMSVALLWVVSTITFFLQALIPGNAAVEILGGQATPAAIHALEVQLKLNQPVYVQYWHWLTNAVHGNLGTSLVSGEPVAHQLNSALPITLSVVIGATIAGIIIGVPLGVLSATKGRRAAKTIDVLSVFGLAVPNFFLALILVSIFSVALSLFPATGYVPFTSSPAQWARALVLPVTALGVGGATLIAKQTRDQMMDVMSRSFIMNLRANGLPTRSIVFRHAARNAAIPVVTVIGLTFVGALGGAVFVEKLFVLPGLGSALVNATSLHDLPMVQGIAVYLTLIVIVVNLLIDLCYGWLNPKVRTTR